MLFAKKVLLSEYKISFWGNWVINTRSQRDNSQNDLTIGDDNINANIVEA